MSGRLHRWAVASVWVVALVWATAVVMGAVNGSDGWGDLPLVIGFGLFLVVGSLLVLRVPENAVSWVMLTIGASAGTMAFADGIWKLAGGGSETGIEVVMSFVNGSMLFLIVPLIGAILPLLFPTGLPPTPRWRWVGMSALVGYLVIMITTAVIHSTEGYEAAQQVGFDPDSAVRVIQFAGLSLWLAAIAGGVASLAVRWHRSEGVERAQLRWLVPSFTLLGIGLLAEFGGFQDSIVAVVFGALGLLLVPISIGFAITKYHLYDIGKIVSRTVTYAVLVGLMVAAYALGATWLPTQLGLESPIFVAATTLAIAMAFNPVRRWLTSHLDRHFNRTPYDPQEVVDALTAELRDTTDASAISDAWAVTVQRALHPTTISVWTSE